ncbi:MAG: SMP-30/gluconolactonase/LRE family protein [Anaerolineales bacterium]
MKLKSLIESGDPELLDTGFEFTEGPLWMDDLGLLFSDIPADKIYKWTEEGGTKIWRDGSGNANGLAQDIEGRLIACEHGTRRVSRTDSDGSVITIASEYQGGRLNSPNDIVTHSSGQIYFTDPPYGIEEADREQPVNGVYRITLDGDLVLLTDDFTRPNGLAFSPDESTLYIDDSGKRHVRVFDVLPDGDISNSRLFADMDHPQPGSPDGMKVDVEGNIYVAGATGLWVFDPDGHMLGVIVTPERPSNCAWGDKDRQTLYITARTSIFRIRTKIPGIAPGTAPV